MVSVHVWHAHGGVCVCHTHPLLPRGGKKKQNHLWTHNSLWLKTFLLQNLPLTRSSSIRSPSFSVRYTVYVSTDFEWKLAEDPSVFPAFRQALSSLHGNQEAIKYSWKFVKIFVTPWQLVASIYSCKQAGQVRGFSNRRASPLCK